MTDSFAHLHVHSEYSMLDGASRVDALMRRTAELGMPAIAITDHGVMFGAIDFYRKGLEHGVKPILGSEIYMAPTSRFTKGSRRDGDEPYYHLTVLAESQQGYGNLMRLVSRAYLEGYWYKPRADKELLKELSDGVICLSGCLGSEVNQLLLAGNRRGALEAAAWYRDVFGPDRYFIELHDHGLAEQRSNNPHLIAIAQELGVGLVVTNDSHYTDQSDAEAHDVLLCIQTGSLKSDEKRMRFTGDQHYVKSPAEMHALFPDHPETWRNTLAIAERCDVKIEFGTYHLPRFDCPPGETEASYLRRKVYEGAARRYPQPLAAEVRERLDYELGVIEQMGFPAYFLIVADLCEQARSTGIRVGPGRGSAAGSAVAYCSGITDLDPLAHGLIFERFLNPERVSMPDIDLDFDERRRGEMIRYATEKYGHDRVAQIVTFSTIKGKQAIRDSARVLGYPYGFGDRLAKMMPAPVRGREFPLDEARARSAELRAAWETEPDARKVLDTARSLEGLRRQHSVHAAGVVISDAPIVEHAPILRLEADGEVVTQYDGGMVESIGLLKMDFLGLRNLTVITDTVRHIQRTSGREVVPEELPLDDVATYEMLSAGDTDGVFQLDSPGMKSLVRQLKPERFEEIVALLALYRPGPLDKGLHLEYVKRKHGAAVSVPHPDLAGILAGTYGILVYQEQVLQIAQKIAGFSLGQADLLRRAMGKKKPKEMEAMKAAFLSGTVATGYPALLGQELWELIYGFAEYAFNKSHSAGYGLVSYQTAWLKRHYPVEYMAALLTSVKNDKDRLPLYLNSCRMMGLTVLPPDVNTSEMDFTPVVDPERPELRQIRFGLTAVRNVGEQVVECTLAARTQKGLFSDFADFARKVDATCLNRRTVESLIKAGAFESLGHPRKGLLQVFEPLSEQALITKRAEGEGQFSLFGGGSVPELGQEVEVPDIEFDKAEKLAAEREMLGLYVSDHPLLGLERLLSDLSSGPISTVAEQANGRAGSVRVAGILTGITRKFTKKGEPYVTGTLEDLAGAIDVMIFPTVYSQASEAIVEDAILCLTGRFDAGDRPKLVVTEVMVPDVSSATGAPLRLTLAPPQCTPTVVERLKGILSEHRGAVPVNLCLADPKGRTTTLRLDGEFSVLRSPGLYAELKQLLGAGGVS